MMPQADHLIGKTIVDFEPHPFPDGRGGTAHDPVIRLDDGSFLAFVVEETESGAYGIEIIRGLRRKHRKGMY